VYLSADSAILLVGEVDQFPSSGIEPVMKTFSPKEVVARTLNVIATDVAVGQLDWYVCVLD
jgi:hypothetical protein